jgi:hypothetical protein
MPEPEGLGVIDTAIDPCKDHDLNEKMQELIDSNVYCYNQSGSSNEGRLSLSAWILDTYEDPDNLPYGASKGTILLVENITPNGANEVQNDYKLALNSGGQKVSVAGLDCSFMPKQYNLTCYLDDSEAAVNLNGDADATVETYTNVMESVLGYES